jgi:hypothetical protein
MTEEQSETLGQLIDRLDNLSYGLDIPIPDSMHVQQLKLILPELTNEFKKSFINITGENPWN